MTQSKRPDDQISMAPVAVAVRLSDNRHQRSRTAGLRKVDNEMIGERLDAGLPIWLHYQISGQGTVQRT